MPNIFGYGDRASAQISRDHQVYWGPPLKLFLAKEPHEDDPLHVIPAVIAERNRGLWGP